jgi:hypothetical protein
MNCGRISLGIDTMSNVAEKTTTVVEGNRPSALHENEILDWDVPPIDAPFLSEKIRVRVRDADAEPMLDA